MAAAMRMSVGLWCWSVTALLASVAAIACVAWVWWATPLLTQDEALSTAQHARIDVETGDITRTPSHPAMLEKDSGAENSANDSAKNAADSAENATGEKPLLPSGLAVAPAEGLSEPSAYGPLPIRSAQGAAAWQYYAKPSQVPPARPVIAIVVHGLGFSSANVQRALALPDVVSLAFTPYAERVGETSSKAREAGHEVFISLPTEPDANTNSDPGPKALLTTLPAEENSARLRWALGRVPGAVGVLTPLHNAFSDHAPSVHSVMQELATRGLGYIGTTPPIDALGNPRGLALPLRTPDAMIDQQLTRSAMMAQLEALEAVALKNGQALAVTEAYPLSLELIGTWSQSLAEKGITLVPASALLRAPEAAQTAP